MSGKHHTDIEADRLYQVITERLSSGMTIPQACAESGVSPATYHRWRRKLGTPERSRTGKSPPVSTDPVKQVRRLEKENARLKQIVAELVLENAFLKDAIQ